MVKIKDIYREIDALAPFDSALEFDNSGFLIGDCNREVKKVLITLDATNETVKEAKEEGVDLILSHHPVIFTGLKKIEEGSVVERLIKEDIAIICAHTNLDMAKSGVNEALAEVLGLKEVEVLKDSDGMGRIGTLTEEMTAEDFVQMTARKLKTAVRYTVKDKIIKRVAVLGGGGQDYWKTAVKNRADAFVTGESKHHILLEAKEKNFLYIDAGHFATEVVVCRNLKKLLKSRFKDIDVVIAKQTPPFETFNIER